MSDYIKVTDKAWGLKGVSGTNPTTNFIGTTDNQDLVFRVNNIEKGRLFAGSNNNGFRLNSSTAFGNILSLEDSFYGFYFGINLPVATIKPDRLQIYKNSSVAHFDSTVGGHRFLIAGVPFLSINNIGAGNSGIRFHRINNATASGSQSITSPIAIDNNGDIVRGSSLMASITSSLTINTLATATPTPVPFNVDDNVAYGTITHSTVTNNSRFTVTRTGKYVIFAQPQMERISNASAACVIWFRKNGTTAVANSSIRYQPGTNFNTVLPLSITLDLVANDYIELMIQTADPNTYQLTNTAGSGTGATEIPNTPACIIDIKGYYI